MGKVWIEKIFDDPEIYVLRVDDGKIRYFEAVWEIPEGITYNAYLLKLPKATVLVDGWKSDYSEEFLKALSKLVDPAEITHVIVHHTEPDHSGTLPKVLEANGYRAKILCSAFAKRLLENFYDITENVNVVSDGERVNVSGKTFRFLMVPWLHWPDTMVTYLEEDGVLLGCDVGGGYSIPNALDDSSDSVVREYLPFVTKYVVTVIGHYRKYILENLEKLKPLPIKAILPGHGLVWRRSPEILLRHYLEVAQGKIEEGKVLVLYDSMYGFVEKLMDEVLKRLDGFGMKPVVFKFSDSERSFVSDVLSHVPSSQALIFGVSTYEAHLHPVVEHVVRLIAEKASYEKPVLVFSVHGWAGVAEKIMGEILGKTHLKVVEFVEVRGGKTEEAKISEAIEKLLKTLGR